MALQTGALFNEGKYEFSGSLTIDCPSKCFVKKNLLKSLLYGKENALLKGKNGLPRHKIRVRQFPFHKIACLSKISNK